MSPERSSRGNPSMGDVLRTVGVLGALVLVVWGVAQIFAVTPDRPTQPVDYRAVAESAQDIASYDLLVPEELPQDWYASVADWESGRWHLGVVTDAEEYIGVRQAATAPEVLLDRFAGGVSTDGSVTVDDRTWRTADLAEGRRAYVTETDHAATLVVGTASAERIERYLASLQPVF